MRALIIDSGQGRGALAAARGLASAGWTVGMGGPTRAGLPMLSCAVRHRHLIPPLNGGTRAFLLGIERAIVARRYDVVFGCSDGEIVTLSRERSRIGARVAYPRHDVTLRAIDKGELGTAAREVGIASPPVAASADEARERWGAGPTIVKERVHGSAHVGLGVFLDPASVDRCVQEMRAAGAVPLIQPLLEGRLMAFTSVLDEQGRMLARVQQVAERTYPRTAGLSVRAETVAVDEQLAEQVSLLLRRLGWFGLSELQFVLPGSGPPILLDLNGRFYGSLALAIAAGVNLPDIWARIATGRMPVQAGDARPGVRYQWLEGDLRAARERSRGALRDLAGCLRYGMGVSAGIWSMRDPLPGLLTACTLMSETARGVAGGRVYRRGRALRVPHG